MKMNRFQLRWLLPGFLALLLSVASVSWAEDTTFNVDAAKSSVDFTLGDVLHTVHGQFQLQNSTIHFDSATGVASGAFVVDANSGASGSKGRDKKMKKEVLETAKYPVIRFTLQGLHGTVPASGTGQVELTGIMNLHGTDHPMTVNAPVQVKNGEASADVHFIVPYVQWGLKNPSTLFLRVSDKVDIVVHAVGTLTNGAMAANHRR